MKKRALNITLSLAITILTVWALQKTIKIDDLFAIFKIISPGWMIIAFCIGISIEFVRTYKAYFLINDPNKQFFDLFFVNNLYVFLNYMLPSKMGEPFFVILTDRYLDIPYEKTVTPFIAVRFFDYLIFMLIALACILFRRWTGLPLPAYYFLWIFFASVILIAIIILTLSLVRTFSLSEFIRKLLIKGGWSGAAERISTIKESILHVHSPKNYIILAMASTFLWTLFFTYNLLILKGLGTTMPYDGIILAIFIVVIAHLIKGFGNLGSHELGWAMALKMSGHPTNQAVLLAFGTHLIYIILMVTLAAISLLYLHFRRS